MLNLAHRLKMLREPDWVSSSGSGRVREPDNRRYVWGYQAPRANGTKRSKQPPVESRVPDSKTRQLPNLK